MRSSEEQKQIVTLKDFSFTGVQEAGHRLIPRRHHLRHGPRKLHTQGFGYRHVPVKQSQGQTFSQEFFYREFRFDLQTLFPFIFYALNYYVTSLFYSQQLGKVVTKTYPLGGSFGFC